MRLTKCLALAMIVAATLTTFVGMSSALAQETALCDVDELECPEESQYPAGTTILASLLGSMTVLSGPINISGNSVDASCLESHLKGKITGAGGEAGASLGSPLEIAIEWLAFEKCHDGCAVTVSELGTFLLLKTGTNLGEAVVHGLLANVACSSLGFLLIYCNFAGGLLKMHATGTSDSTAAMLSASKVPLEISESQFFCPKHAEIDLAYEISSPTPLYISN